MSEEPLSKTESLDFELLTLLEQEASLTQREIADRPGIGLGKINYCLKALAGKGAIKIANFRNSENKVGYVYVLRPRGLANGRGSRMDFLHAG